MSFSSEIKENIISADIKNRCCEKAFLRGILAAKCYIDGDSVCVNLTPKSSVRCALLLIEKIYKTNVDVFHRKDSGIAITLSFISADALEFADMLDSGIAPIELFAEKCPQCRMHFLRGLFLSCGRVADPVKQYLLEFSVSDRADHIESFLWDYDLHPKRYDRRGEKLLVLKDSTSVEEFFVLLGINRYAYSVMNAKIEHDLRNRANRRTNCETGNIARSVRSSSVLITLIGRLIDEGHIDDLPPELADTARVRYEHSELSLSALCHHMPEPITKSGLKHRLDKLSAVATQMLGMKK